MSTPATGTTDDQTPAKQGDLSVSEVATTPKPSRRLTRTIFGVMLALLTAFGTSLVTAGPAAAAGNISYCFKHANGSAYQHETYLQLWYNGTWNTVQYKGKNINGCHSFNIFGAWSTYPARMIASTRMGTITYAAVTPYYAPAGSWSYNLGTGVVNNGPGW